MPPLLCYPNYADQAVLSGGSSQLGAPLSNLQTRFRNQYWRTTDANPVSSCMHFDFQQWVYLTAFALSNHNLTLSAKLRLVLWGDTASTNQRYDSGWQWAWPRYFKTSSLRWHDSNFWGGRIAKQVQQGVRPLWVHVLSDALAPVKTMSVRAADLYISDPLNPMGYIQAGRMFAGPDLGNALGMDHGATLQWVDPTTVDRSLDGTKWFEKRTKYRKVAFTYKWMAETEGVNQSLMLTELAGLSEELLYLFDPLKLNLLQQRAFIGTLSALNPLAWWAYGILPDNTEDDELTSMAFELEESV